MTFRSLCLFAAVILIARAAAPLSAQPATEVDNVAAFARLYGVARWFYPSDAAAALDWNRFAIDGIRRVRGARTPAELETTLKQLFTPLGPGIEIGTSPPPKRNAGARSPELIGWHYRGPGITEGIPGPYSAKRTNRSVSVPRAPQSTSSILMQVIIADTLRGKDVRMRGQMRANSPSAQGWAGLWLRVDRTGQTMGFFDNMQDRPVRDTAWREYVIEGTIASDARQIVFGALSVGSMSVDVDAIEIAVRTRGGSWTPLVIPDAGFEATSNSGALSWAQNPPTAFTRPTMGAAQGSRFARITPAAPQVAATPSTRPSDSLETPMAGAVIDIALARGLHARVPLSLTDAEARTETPALATLRTALASVAAAAGRDDADVRLADATVAWNVFRHFYPYWGDIDVN